MTDEPSESGGDVAAIEQLHIETSDESDGSIVVSVRGEVDIESAPALQSALASAAS